jgi:rhodanese-related sulfurtransferase
MQMQNLTSLLKLLLGSIVSLLFWLATAHAEVINVNPAEFAKLVATGVPVIDIRTAPEWKETGVVAGSKLMTFFDEKGQVDARSWVEHLKPIAGLNQPVILICRTGNRTSTVSQFLSQQVGYKTVYNVSGGIYAWMKAGNAVVPASFTTAK